MRSTRSLLLLASMILATGANASPMTKAPTPAQFAGLAKLPDWSGVWTPEWGPLFASREAQKPVLKPAAAKELAAFEAGKLKGENLQVDSANCIPAGLPEVMRKPYPIEFIYSPERVTIIAETGSQVRRVYTDGRPLPDDPDPTFNGSSVGRWEGETLVIETIGLNPRISLSPGVHPTEKTRIVERLRIDKADHMVLQTTITDPDVFVEPLVLVTGYVRKRDWEMREYVCQENNHDAADPFGRPSMSLGN
jgi:hypothetical protein